ncbi:hypothetical protein M1L60_16625 [Actinoplanes sp. TRM 88003]|uniref:Uncharacterized protein n=1 Tax=Paractinoplanes aksuensis TaxID=2939490 RepID=A0ABT1DN43_9ACTN|nr:hypothetical protein [Actinoplanes aksuensis]MCO8272220.1 hypothetical protein [Actinoplanes aksuensis]
MTVRDEVRRYVDLGPLPPEDDGEDEAGDEVLEALEEALLAIEAPVTDEEAELLLTVFGPDECYGLAWTTLHLVETSPTAFPRTEPAPEANEWHRRLWLRSQNALADS